MHNNDAADSLGEAWSTAGNPGADNLDTVRRFLEPHLAKLWQGGIPLDRRLAVGCDVTGTLISPSGPLIDDFMCDLHDLGLPVYIVTSNRLKDGRLEGDFKIFRRLEASGRDWLVFKPAMPNEMTGFLVDDDEFIRDPMEELYDATAIHPENAEFVKFLKAWSRLGGREKQAVLQPWIHFCHPAPEHALEHARIA